jgi:hypothetical protein
MEQLDLEALARGDRVAAEVLVDLCRKDPSLVFEDNIFNALLTLSKTRSLTLAWQALLAQLKGAKVSVSGIKRAIHDKGEEEEGSESGGGRGAAGDSHAERLLGIAEEHEYFRDDLGTPYMSIEHGSRRETLKLRSTRARLFFIRSYKGKFGKPPSDAALRGVIEALVAEAAFGDEVCPVYIRRARHNGAIYFDRGTPDGSAYEIDKVGPRIVLRPPVRFYRPPGTLPLVEAALDSDPQEALSKLRELTRFQSEDDCVVVVGFMTDAAGGVGPFAVLLITGESGSTKTTLAGMIIALFDPRVHLLLTEPSSKREVFIHSANRSILGYNNMSSLPKSISDALCTVGEGGTDSQRSLYTNDEESSIKARIPVILAAIDNIVTQGDLANRLAKIELAAVPRGERLSEADFLAKFNASAPVILGGFLNALSVGLRRYDDADISNLPRMAEFSRFASACETAFWPEGTFATAFAEAAATASDDVLSGDPVSRTFMGFMADKAEWEGTATDLLFELETIVRRPEREAELALAELKSEAKKGGVNRGYMTASEKEQEKELSLRIAEAAVDWKEARERVHATLDNKWPRGANALSVRLKGVGPQLRGAGISIAWPTSHKDGRLLRAINFLQRGTTSTEGSSPLVPISTRFRER